MEAVGPTCLWPTRANCESHGMAEPDAGDGGAKKASWDDKVSEGFSVDTMTKLCDTASFDTVNVRKQRARKEDNHGSLI